MIKGKWVACPRCNTHVFRLIGLFYRSIKDSPLCDGCLSMTDVEDEDV